VCSKRDVYFRSLKVLILTVFVLFSGGTSKNLMDQFFWSQIICFMYDEQNSIQDFNIFHFAGKQKIYLSTFTDNITSKSNSK